MAIFPINAFAEGGVTRKEGYLLLWHSINRPAYETIQIEPYVDVPKGADGELEITFGKRRGILEKDDYFSPDNLLSRNDALLWLYRTRNVDELPNMQYEHLQSLSDRFPVIDPNENELINSAEELFEMMQKLDLFLVDEVHEVSFYADDFHGKGTAFGETFDMNEITAAHRSYPQDTLVKVTNIDNGKEVVVRINDRGPYVDGRDMDLSKAAFQEIAPIGTGVINAKFQRLGDKDQIDLCSNQKRKYQRRITRNVRFHRGVPHQFNVGEKLWLGSIKWFVVRGITYPDGTFMRFQDFISPEERFYFSPSIVGDYKFIIGTKEGRQREFRMTVNSCPKI